MPSDTQRSRKAPRLGKGLSSLIGQPVPAQPSTAPAPDKPTPPPAPAPPAGDHHPQPAPPAQAESAELAQSEEKGPQSQTPHPDQGSPASNAEEGPADRVVYLTIASIHANRAQPRQTFDEASLAALAASIRHDGVLQPIIVRSPSQAGQYELVAGERRWRAAQLAGLTQIPAIVRQVSDQQAAEWALVENLQREDLNPIERAQAFQALLDHHKLTHDEVAEHVGVDRSTISNTLRLLHLHPDVQELVRRSLLSAGHARALAGLSDAERQRSLAQRVIREEWSVRKLEQALRASAAQLGDGDGSVKPRLSEARPTSHLKELEEQISQQLGMRVRLQPSKRKGAGRLTIEFPSLDGFDQLMERLGVDIDQT